MTSSSSGWSSKLSHEDAEVLRSARVAAQMLSASADTPEVRAQLAEKKKQLEVLTTRLMKKVVESETNKLSTRAADHAAAWRVISGLRDVSPECPIPTDKLVQHFSALSHPTGLPLLPTPLQPTPASLTAAMEPLSPAEVIKAFQDTNTASAPGPDGIPPSLVTEAFFSGPGFEFIFNFLAMCLLLAVVPLHWREATFFVLYKGSGDPCDPNNYRAIALTSAFGKLFERILLGRLQQWFRSSRLWLLPQFGFRRASSCAQAIFLLRTLALDVITTRKAPVYVAFVDLRKAFPSVGRDALFKRMIDLGIPYPLVLAVRSFYVANVARLRVDNTLTKDFFVAAGVLEGSVLSPFLFGVLFSVIWDLFVTAPFPSCQLRVYNRDALWLIAYADDLAVITLSAVKLETVLNKLAHELKHLNLIMRLTNSASFVTNYPFNLLG